MRIALDPYMLRDRPFAEVCRIAADIGYDSIELSPRPDFIPFFSHPRADRAKVAEFRAALRRHGDGARVDPAPLPLVGAGRGRAAGRRALLEAGDPAVRRRRLHDDELRVQRPPGPAGPQRGPVLEVARGAPPDLRARGDPAQPRGPPRRLHGAQRAAPSTWSGRSTRRLRRLCLLRAAHLPPGRRHRGDDRVRGPVLRQVHVADVLNHRASSGLRYIVNPPGSTARVHQHLDIGQGEVDFEACFRALRTVGFDGILTSCVFAWEERAVESSRFMFERIRALLDATAPGA